MGASDIGSCARTFEQELRSFAFTRPGSTRHWQRDKQRQRQTMRARRKHNIVHTGDCQNLLAAGDTLRRTSCQFRNQLRSVGVVRPTDRPTDRDRQCVGVCVGPSSPPLPPPPPNSLLQPPTPPPSPLLPPWVRLFALGDSLGPISKVICLLLNVST